MNKVCQQCQSPFSGHFNARFCSDDCRLQRRLIGNKIWGATYRTKNRKPQPEREPIPPFPDGIDRERFGDWLSGFCDGESTFGLKAGVQYDRPRPRINHSALFRITLRDDDASILSDIQSYWQCGIIIFNNNIRSKIPNAKPVAAYCVQAVSDLMKIVVPHFEQFPLRSKKRNDFLIWKQGIALMSVVQSRPTVGRLRLSGIMPKWTEEDREKFQSLSELLKHQRIYS